MVAYGGDDVTIEYNFSNTIASVKSTFTNTYNCEIAIICSNTNSLRNMDNPRGISVVSRAMIKSIITNITRT